MNKISIPQFFKDYTGSVDDFRLLLDNLERGTADVDKYGDADKQLQLLQELHNSFVGIHPTDSDNSIEPSDIGEWFYYNHRYYHGGGSGGGTQGTQGIQGLQGPAGSGTGGGTQGYQGYQGFQGIQGFQGATGEGIQGTQGPAGSGTGGAQGYQGIQGFQGATGEGIQGIQGIMGTIGTQGEIGATGTQGYQGIQGPAGGGSDTDTKNTVGNHEVQGQILFIVGVQSVQGTSSEDYAISYSHEAYTDSDTELKRVATEILPEGSSQPDIDAKVAAMRVDLTKGNTGTSGFNDKKQTIEDLNDNGSLNPYVNPHTIDGLLPDSGTAGANNSSSFTTLVSEYEAESGKPLMWHIGEDGWFYIGKHRVLVDADMNALWDIINNRWNPEKWPSVTASRTSFNPLSIGISDNDLTTNDLNKFKVAGFTNNASAVNITNGSTLNFPGVGKQISFRDGGISIYVKPTFTEPTSTQLSQTIIGYINGMNNYGWRESLDPTAEIKHRPTGNQYDIQKSATFTSTVTKNDLKRQAELILKFAGNDNNDTIVADVENTNNNDNLTITSFDTIPSIKHGKNKFTLNYTNPSNISIASTPGNLDGISTVYYLSNRGNMNANHHADYAGEQGIYIPIDSITGPSSKGPLYAHGSENGEKTTNISFYSVLPIFTNSYHCSSNKWFGKGNYNNCVSYINSLGANNFHDRNDQLFVYDNYLNTSGDNARFYQFNYFTKSIGQTFSLYVIFDYLYAAADARNPHARIAIPNLSHIQGNGCNFVLGISRVSVLDVTSKHDYATDPDSDAAMDYASISLDRSGFIDSDFERTYDIYEIYPHGGASSPDVASISPTAYQIDIVLNSFTSI